MRGCINYVRMRIMSFKYIEREKYERMYQLCQNENHEFQMLDYNKRSRYNILNLN